MYKINFSAATEIGVNEEDTELEVTNPNNIRLSTMNILLNDFKYSAVERFVVKLLFYFFYRLYFPTYILYL